MCCEEGTQTRGVGAEDASCQFNFTFDGCVSFLFVGGDWWGKVLDLRPDYDGLECVGDVAVTYVYPGHDTEETHQTNDTRAAEIASAKFRNR